MTKPVGGRGKKAPYETTMVRVPVPIKSEVDEFIAKRRNQLLSEDADDSADDSSTELEIAHKLVNKFIEETGLTDKLDVKRYVRSANLVKFLDWISDRMSRKDAPQ